MAGYKREVFPGEAFRKWRRVDLRRPDTWPAMGGLAVMCMKNKEYNGMNHYSAGRPDNIGGALHWRYGMGGSDQVSALKKQFYIWFCTVQEPRNFFSMADPKTWPESGKPVILRLERKDGKAGIRHSAGHFERRYTRTLWWFHEHGNERATDLTKKYYIEWDYLPEFDGKPYEKAGR